MSQDITLAQVLREVIESRIADVHVALPGKVESYDNTTQLADIKPLTQRTFLDADGQEVSEQLPVIPSVPLVFPRAGSWFISFPITAGDTVQIIFNERSLDKWLENGKDVDPQDLRYHTLDGAAAIPGLYAKPDALTSAHADNMVIGKDDGVQIHIKGDGTINLGAESPSDAVALASLVLSELQNIQTALTAQKTTINTHTHPTGVGPSGVAVPQDTSSYSASDPASTKVLAE